MGVAVLRSGEASEVLIEGVPFAEVTLEYHLLVLIAQDGGFFFKMGFMLMILREPLEASIDQNWIGPDPHIYNALLMKGFPFDCKKAIPQKIWASFMFKLLNWSNVWFPAIKSSLLFALENDFDWFIESAY